MDLKKLRHDLEEDEGVKYEIYLDHLGLPTFGIGHLIKTQDPEYRQPIGTKVSEDRVQEAFLKDIESVHNDCYSVFKQFDKLPQEVQLIVANMLFNLGIRRFSRFKRFILAVKSHKYNTAADEMMDSKWYRQVTNRAERLRKRMIAEHKKGN